MWAAEDELGEKKGREGGGDDGRRKNGIIAARRAQVARNYDFAAAPTHDFRRTIFLNFLPSARRRRRASAGALSRRDVTSPGIITPRRCCCPRAAARPVR